MKLEYNDNIYVFNIEIPAYKLSSMGIETPEEEFPYSSCTLGVGCKSLWQITSSDVEGGLRYHDETRCGG